MFIRTIVYLHPLLRNTNLTILKTIWQLPTTHKESVNALSCPRALHELSPLIFSPRYEDSSCHPQPIWLSFCSLNTPNSFPSQSFCTFWSFCPENCSQGFWLNLLLLIFEDSAHTSPSFLNFYLSALFPLLTII